MLVKTNDEVCQPIAVMRGSVLASRNELDKKVRNYRQKNRKVNEDDSSDMESEKPSNPIKDDTQGKAKDEMATYQTKEPTLEITR
jgi:hypothetical protein